MIDSDLGRRWQYTTFHDRKEAGHLLAQKLAEMYRREDAVVYALPRGGVVLGVEIAKQLEAPLDLVIPRKIGHPEQEEYAICAVTEKGYLLCNQQAIARLDPEWLKAAAESQVAEARRRRETYQGSRAAVPVKGKVAIITDDGVATGLTMLAAIQDVSDGGPAKVVIAAPVVPQDTVDQLLAYADEIVALMVPEVFRGSISAYYEQFAQVDDEEVVQLISSVPGRK